VRRRSLDEPSYFLIARRHAADTGVLVLKLPDGETVLPVFSFREEAGIFPWREAEGELAGRGGPLGRRHRAAACSLRGHRLGRAASATGSRRYRLERPPEHRAGNLHGVRGQPRIRRDLELDRFGQSDRTEIAGSRGHQTRKGPEEPAW
jgi:hypothetical protein